MLSQHFTVEEFACHDGTPYPADWVDTRLAALLSVLDPAREAHGGPVDVISGYRTDVYNRAVGGARDSQHPRGTAADVRPRVVRAGVEIHWEHTTLPERIEVVSKFNELFISLLRAGRLPLLGGFGYYPGKWLHLDVRPRPADGHIARWVGVGVGSEV